jgi:hypothetical protein
MAVQKLKKGFFSGTSKIFDGTLEKVINSIIDAVNGAGGGGVPITPVTTADATSPEEAVTLANANKAKLNELIALIGADSGGA